MLGYKEISCPKNEYSRDAHAHWMYSKTRRDKLRNEYILTKIGVPLIEEEMRKNCLR